MENVDEKNNLIYEYSIKVQELVHELEKKIDDRIRSCMVYYGDLKNPEGEEYEGTKLSLSVEPEIEFDIGNDVEPEWTPQQIIKNYHLVENNLKNLMSDSLGLNHITDIYMKLIEEEKIEARKALGEDNKEYFNLL